VWRDASGKELGDDRKPLATGAKNVTFEAPNGPMLTTQLFFPDVAQNARDGIFDPSLLMNVTDNGDGSLSATYNFVVATA